MSCSRLVSLCCLLFAVASAEFSGSLNAGTTSCSGSEVELLIELQEKMAKVTDRVYRQGADFGSGHTPSWELIFTHSSTNPSAFSNDCPAFTSTPTVDDVSSCRALKYGSSSGSVYSNLISIDDLRTGPTYKFRMQWQGNVNNSPVTYYIEWEQNYNPIAVSNADVSGSLDMGLNILSVSLAGDSGSNFHGLSRSSSPDKTFLDGMKAAGIGYAVGATSTANMRGAYWHYGGAQGSHYDLEMRLFIWH